MANRAWFWCTFGAVTMSLGWGLRGYIGGSSLGAMIPGAMIGLALCLLLDREEDAAYIAAYSAIGVGFGGQETYGQTVGLSFLPETYSWAILGFALKGGIWGFLGGAVMGIAFSPKPQNKRSITWGFALMVAATYAGWKLINEPKLIYFSNRLDRPRAELWAGLVLGALALLLFLWQRGMGRLPWRFAFWGGLGGGIGFASGAALQVWGRGVDPNFAVGWWKMMEFTFGACLGGAFAFCAWLHRSEIRGGAPAAEDLPPPLRTALLAAVIVILMAVALHPRLGTRMNYTVVGALLLTLVLYWRPAAWQAAITTTYCAFAVDLMRNRPEYSAAGMWTFIVVSTIAVCVLTTLYPRVRPALVLLTATSVGMGLLKGFLPPWPGNTAVGTQIAFVMLAMGVLAAIALADRPSAKSRTAA